MAVITVRSISAVSAAGSDATSANGTPVVGNMPAKAAEAASTKIPATIGNVRRSAAGIASQVMMRSGHISTMHQKAPTYGVAAVIASVRTTPSQES